MYWYQMNSSGEISTPNFQAVVWNSGGNQGLFKT